MTFGLMINMVVMVTTWKCEMDLANQVLSLGANIVVTKAQVTYTPQDLVCSYSSCQMLVVPAMGLKPDIQLLASVSSNITLKAISNVLIFVGI
jgi:hypothetical protein